EVSIVDLFDRVLPRLRERAAAAKMELRVVPPPPEIRVQADVDTVEQILFNLVDNACKYAGEAPDCRIDMRAEAHGRHVVVSVSDHGPGISRRDRRLIFRPFARSAESKAGSAPGVGLGLALSRRLARAMGGDVTLGQSSQGAIVNVTLPFPRE